MLAITRDRVTVAILLLAGLVTGLGPSRDPLLAFFWVVLGLVVAVLGALARDGRGHQVRKNANGFNQPTQTPASARR